MRHDTTEKKKKKTCLCIIGTPIAPLQDFSAVNRYLIFRSSVFSSKIETGAGAGSAGSDLDMELVEAPAQLVV
jgi:hypothetical protein